jgi:outer membrane protein OmpA-like peptidoglycan-associated protein
MPPQPTRAVRLGKQGRVWLGRAAVAVGLAHAGGCVPAAWVGGGVGALAGGAVTYGVLQPARCGQLQRLTTRGASGQWTLGSGLLSQISARFGIEERRLADDLTSDDVQIFNTQSIVCRLVEKGMSPETGARWLEVAYSRRMQIEQAAERAGVKPPEPDAVEAILRTFGRRTGRDMRERIERQVLAFRDSVRRASDAAPGRAWAGAGERQDALLAAVASAVRGVLAEGGGAADVRGAVLALDIRVERAGRRLEAADAAASRIDAEVTRLTGALAELRAASEEAAQSTTNLRFLTEVARREVGFAFDSDTISEPERTEVARWAGRFADPRYSFSIVGLTDPTGDAEYNRALSRRRSLAVQRVLLEDAGIPALRVSAIGVGTSMATAGRTAAQMRRVLITVHGMPTAPAKTALPGGASQPPSAHSP